MKKAILIIAAAALMAACTPTQSASWLAYCEHHGYNPSTSDPAVIDRYLDTWLGSAAEEEALNNTQNH